MTERKMSDVEKMAEQCRAWAQQIINDGTSSQAGPDASDMLAMAATLDALSALGGWDDAITDEMKAAGRHAVGMVADAGSFEIMAVEAYKAMSALRRPAATCGWNEAIDGLGDFLYAIEPIAARPGPYGTAVSISPVEARTLLDALRRPATGEG